jgi:hypothetical protein
MIRMISDTYVLDSADLADMLENQPATLKPADIRAALQAIGIKLPTDGVSLALTAGDDYSRLPLDECQLLRDPDALALFGPGSVDQVIPTDECCLVVHVAA